MEIAAFFESGILQSMVLSLVLTLLLELLFAVIFRLRNSRDLLLLCLVNLITNPVVVLLNHIVAGIIPYEYAAIVLLALEVSAVAVEALYYKNYGEKFNHPVWFAIGANLFSFVAGRAIQMLSVIL